MKNPFRFVLLLLRFPCKREEGGKLHLIFRIFLLLLVLGFPAGFFLSLRYMLGFIYIAVIYSPLSLTFKPFPTRARQTTASDGLVVHGTRVFGGG